MILIGKGGHPFRNSSHRARLGRAELEKDLTQCFSRCHLHDFSDHQRERFVSLWFLISKIFVERFVSLLLPFVVLATCVAKRRKLSLVCYPVGVHSDNFSSLYMWLFGCKAFSESLFYLTRPMNHTVAHDNATGTLDLESCEGALCFLSTKYCVRIRLNRDIMITDFAYMYHFVPNHGRGFYGGRGGGVDEEVEVLAVADW